MTGRASVQTPSALQVVVDDRAKQLYSYLEEGGLITAFENVMGSMFDMDPDLPTDPIKYIKENTGYTMKEAREASRELQKLRMTTEIMERENQLLRSYLDGAEKSEQSGDWSSGSESQIKMNKKKWLSCHVITNEGNEVSGLVSPRKNERWT
ncbi:uncharacterized protein LOC106661525 isoform X1 [Cimex lectularius]|uniref:Uncharacterized protein n=1 Tax=Cimex lectularius TaxID=79782 RepID=A0A8I6R7T1_CIMLE|nr:uncharacterized protein LOC106661525 isoform X1 [Cimex lectularius]